MLLHQLKQREQFTNQEQSVADYLLAHLDELEALSATALAQASYTSKATVVRLSQKLGLSGFQEFKVKLLVELNQQKRLDQLLEQEPIRSDSSQAEILDALPSLYDKAFTNTKLTLSKSHVTRIINELIKAERIEFYATGVAYHLAQAAAFKLATLGREVSVYESVNSHYVTAREKKKTVAFFLSFTGANRQVIEMAHYMKETSDARVIGIGGPHYQDLKANCHEFVEIPNRDSLLSLDVISSFAAMNYVLDVFFALLLSKQYDKQLALLMEESE